MPATITFCGLAKIYIAVMCPRHLDGVDPPESRDVIHLNMREDYQYISDNPLCKQCVVVRYGPGTGGNLGGEDRLY